LSPGKIGPEHAIWFQRQGDTRAFVNRMNDQYRYQIYDKYGKPLTEGFVDTLKLATQAVFEYFEKMEK
jgi:hypothetical protein